MAAEQWMEIYRSYGGEELASEITTLQKDLSGGFRSQGSGSVQHERDLQELRDRLQAAVRVKNERNARGSGNGNKGRVSFGGSWGDM